MGRKVIAFWLSLTMVLSFIIVLDVIIDFTPTVEGGIIRYVNETGSGGAYTKIQDAINASSDGDTVFVYNGTYFENVVVNKTINLTGEEMNATIIDGGGNGDTISIVVDSVNITGFSITGSGLNSHGIYLNNVNNCSISKNNISYNSKYGVYIYYSNNSNLNNNFVSNNWYGLYFYYSDGNEIENNSVSDNLYGIHLYTCQGNNIVANKALTNNQYGIYLGTSSGNKIMDNNASNNLRGIYLEGSSQNNVTSNIASSNEWTGIYLYYSGMNSIVNNFASDNKNGGIYLSFSSENNITWNTLMRNGFFIGGNLLEHWNTHYIDTSNTVNGRPIYYLKNQTGSMIPPGAGQVILANCSYIIIDNQDLTRCNVGIELGFSFNNNITSNNVSSNQYGIYLYNSNGNNITDNNASNDVNIGIYLYLSNSNIIENNRIMLNGGYGLNLKSSHRNIIASNDASQNVDYGMYFESSSLNNIIDNNVSKNIYGIRLFLSNNNNLSYNNVSSNTRHGFTISDSNKNRLKNNNASKNENGIFVSDSEDNIITDNTVYSNSGSGIEISYSRWTAISNNTMINDGLFISGSSLYHWNSHDIDILNTVNGKPIYYWKNQTGGLIPQGAGQVILANSTNIKISNQNLTNCVAGIEMAFSSNNNITGNNVSFNKWYGFYVYWSTTNNFIGNTILNNSRGIYFRVSSENNITDNIISLSNQEGIHLFFSSKNNIIDNLVVNNDYGLYLSTNSKNNQVYYNIIINNVKQAYDDHSDNSWDNGYPFGGNYWSDYLGSDTFKGPYQNIPGSDGIGDTNYSIDSDSMDRYPLMAPYKSLENYTILKQGWNLISIPLIQEEQNLTRILGSIDGWYDAVQWYDITNTKDPWKHHKVGKPFGNDLSKLNETMGFWIHITQPGDTIFLYNGTEPTINQTITLHPGWNQVGYPSLTSYNRTQGLNNLTFGTHVDAIWTYNAATQTWKKLGPSDYFEIGRGYWVHAKTKCEWEIPL